VFLRGLALTISLFVLSSLFPTTAYANVTATQISTTAYPLGLSEDSTGNIFIADGNGANQGVFVVPESDGTIFGQSVTEGNQQLLFPLAGALGVAFNASGDLFICTSGGALYVVTRTNKSVFGVSVTANSLTQLFSTGAMAGGMQFDASGNLFGGRSGNGGVVVLPTTAGPLFGQIMTPNVINTLSASNLDWTADVAFDNAGNFFITQMFDSARRAGVYVLPNSTGSLYGINVVANTLIALAEYPNFGTRHPCGISIDSNDTIFYVSWIQKTVYAMPTTSRTVLGQSIPADSFTRLTGANSYADQGVLSSSDATIITGGPSATYRLESIPTFTATFDANSPSATGVMSPQTSSSAAALRPNEFELEGFTFAGWATSPTGDIAYTDGSIYPFTSSTTLFARWAAPGEVIPIIMRLAPPDVHQSLGIPGDADCSQIDDKSLNWAGVSDGGWGKSWAQWPNAGSGGFVCNRILRYSLDNERWYTVR
jgi:hypothetical protein